jgi:hypothetical protein
MRDEVLEARLAWVKADAEADAAEAELADDWKRFEAGVGSPPSRELLAEVARLRRLADEKLTALMMLLSSARRTR